MIKTYRLLFALIIYGFAVCAWADKDVESVEKTRLTATEYEHGRNGVKQDFKQAFDLYCRAALSGDAESAYSLGFMYFNGRGVSRDLSLAVHWFMRAADSGDKQAKLMLSRFAAVGSVEDTACKPDEPVFKQIVETDPSRQLVANWVNQIAPGYGIDPQLVMAVIQAESAFNPVAISGKNAQGLMQLIPETAERFGVKDSWNPIQNIKGGTAYLHWLLRHFDGRVDWVLAAYNAGEGAVERYKGIPPYPETQNYVKQIQAFYTKALHPVPPETPAKTVVLEHKI